MAQNIAAHLEDGIVSGVLPAGSRLVEADLCEEFSASRTPVRQALDRLQAQGLIERRPRKGAFVRPITVADSLAVYVAREALEGAAARLVAETENRETVQALRSCLKAQKAELKAGTSRDRMFMLDMEFHRTIREATGNPYLIRFLRRIEQSLVLAGPTTYKSPGRMEESVHEHEMLLDALADQDGDSAFQLAMAHIHAAKTTRLRMLSLGVE